MNAQEFRELVGQRVPAWANQLAKLEELTHQEPIPEILLKPGSGLAPFRVVMLLEVLGWSGDMLEVRAIVGDTPHFGTKIHINPPFLQFFRLYVANPVYIHRSRVL